MTDLDAMLAAVQALPADTRLETIEDAVMRGLAHRQEQTSMRRSAILAGLLAIGVGWVASIAPALPARAAPTPIGMSDYAPSHLLDR